MAPSSKARAIGSVEEQIRESIATKQRLLADGELLQCLKDSAAKCADTLRSGGKVLTAGNGGSAADAQHIAGELVSRFHFDRPPTAGIALTTDSSVLTAIGNDYGYEQLFARQVAALGRRDDVFIAISTSGNSPNILTALKQARQLGVYCIGLSGQGGGKMKPLCDALLCVPSDETPRIQEAHGLIAHILCAQIEALLFAGVAG